MAPLGARTEQCPRGRPCGGPTLGVTLPRQHLWGTVGLIHWSCQSPSLRAASLLSLNVPPPPERQGSRQQVALALR